RRRDEGPTMPGALGGGSAYVLVRARPLRPSAHFARVAAAELGLVLAGPLGEAGGAGRRSVGIEQAAHEAGDLLARDDNVAEERVERVGDEVAESRGDVDDPPARTERVAQHADQV